ncbi:MAG: hypothetical protein A2W35_00300 [Chloroflexi bacterium RBG_16_57_11]|nr:MAG: hypothetical protein A2W35_00300 [Chloroflexi bacterium RBG_16_57_11]
MQRDLSSIFNAVGEALRQNRDLFNQADPVNRNHGDHMVQVFELAARAADEKRDASVAEAMEYGAHLLDMQADNGSAQMYAHGLGQLARQLRRYDLTLDDLLLYVQGALSKDKDSGAGDLSVLNQPASGRPLEPGASSGDVLKALMNGLAGWGQIESGQVPTDNPLDMGALFEFGMAYIQAKQRGGSRIEILADAAASVSPLSKTPHRYLSGKLAIQALLTAMQGTSTGLLA